MTFMYSLETGKADDWPVQLLVNDEKPFNFKIYTGAQRIESQSMQVCKH